MDTSLSMACSWSYHNQLHMPVNVCNDLTMSTISLHDDCHRLNVWDDCISNSHSVCETPTLSSAGSDCSEEIVHVVTDECLGLQPFDNVLFDNLGGLFIDPTLNDDYCEEDDLSSSCADTISCSSDDVKPTSVQSTRSDRSNQLIDPLSCTLLWSEMDEELQLNTIESLSRTISTQLGIREQLDVIQILDARANVSPSDTEFAIDLNCLTDSKLKEVREYIRKYVNDNNKSRNKDSFNDNDTDWYSSNLSAESTRHKTSKKEVAKERKNQLKAAKQQRKKQYRQLLKEKRSGLFVREEVLALSSCPPHDEEVEIDIGIDEN